MEVEQENSYNCHVSTSQCSAAVLINTIFNKRLANVISALFIALILLTKSAVSCGFGHIYFIFCAMARPSDNGPRMEKELTNFCPLATYPDLIVFVLVENLNCRKTSVNRNCLKYQYFT